MWINVTNSCDPHFTGHYIIGKINLTGKVSHDQAKNYTTVICSNFITLNCQKTKSNFLHLKKSHVFYVKMSQGIPKFANSAIYFKYCKNKVIFPTGFVKIYWNFTKMKHISLIIHLSLILYANFNFMFMKNDSKISSKWSLFADKSTIIVVKLSLFCLYNDTTRK